MKSFPPRRPTSLPPDQTYPVLVLEEVKPINDLHGHAVGDEVLLSLAILLRKDLRIVDNVVRYGGEEFLVILPETPLEGAIVAAERIRARVAAVEIGPLKLKVTVSVGVAADPTEDVLVRADRAMYFAKRNGKNRVEVWDKDGKYDPRP